RPIERIGRVAERIGSSNLHERIAVEGLPEELRRVVLAFNTMLDRLGESFARVGQFSDDVAHELRTPVNNLRGQIEVALSRTRSSEDYEQVLGSCLEECGRISRIVSSLLFLARVGGSDALSIGQAVIAREIDAVRDFYEASTGEAGLTIATDAPSDLSWPLDRTLFQQALGNLVSNAIAHGGTATAIEITAQVEGRRLHVTVSDDGDGIGPVDRQRLFDRFYRADRARAGTDHAGLGLSMVKAIVERHGGTVTLTSTVGTGTAVTMAFARLDDDSDA
ncbi:MAG: HAMP domain-containing protein, partial [Betaproteobacteria bacterium]|nr:HAMP domain-containing protein [Betaproteobacteria bacterium]